MSASIHPSAIVDPAARIGSDVTIGPFCIVGPDVEIGDGTSLISHAVVTGHTTMGRNNRVFPFATIGHEPQDLKFHGEASQVIIGDDNTIRENVTINPGTEGGGMLTRLGNGNLLMAYAHIAHDCLVDNGAILANAATLAGHVEVHDGAIIGGLTAVHQFVRVGKYSMVGGMSAVHKDAPPYSMLKGGYHAAVRGLNLVGLRRRNFGADTIRRLKELYGVLLSEQGGKMEERLNRAEALAGNDEHAQHLVDFVRQSRRGVTLLRPEAE